MARRFRLQAAGCELFGSPLYGALLARAADDIEAQGAVWRVLEGYADDPGGSMLALRLMGATHRLALDGAAPGLAAHYPSTGGDGDAEGAWAAWYALLNERPDEVTPLVARGVQTNEVARCASLLGGFLEVARRTGLPLRILEVGASAGLNLRWDHYRYGAAGHTWGPPDSPVDMGDPFTGGRAPNLLPTAADVDVVQRRGCDVAPVDAASTEGRQTLLSFVWPDQLARLAKLRGALEVAANVPCRVDRRSADEWITEQLSVPATGSATVVFHSVMLQYVERAARTRLLASIAAAGERATADAPLAWLRMEPASARDAEFPVRLTMWPSGEDRRVGVTHPHGTWVRWLD